MSASLPPRTQDEWHEHAAVVNARLALLQRHIEPEFLYVVCTACGADREYHPHDRISFAYDCSTHICGDPVEQQEAATLTVTASPQLELF